MRFKFSFKSNLPEKICVVCGKPFHARKKTWMTVHEDERFCSERCRNNRRKHLLGVIQHRHTSDVR
ncbi:MAG: DUF2256 domain-containing protein [Chitinophagales bacterium]